MSEISDDDIYPDSATTLVVLRGLVTVTRLRAVVHWTSNVGFFVRLPGGRMVAVSKQDDDTYLVNLPGDV
jgi:hypothetical protein